MNENIYMHGIGNSSNIDSNLDYNPKGQRSSFYSILDSGELKSRRKLGSKTSYGFNGLDYISLCDYSKKDIYNTGSNKKYNAYSTYISGSISICFDKDKIEDKIIVPTIVDVCTNNLSGFAYMQKLGLSNDERYSDYPDEVQVKDSLSLDNMCQITFPTHSFLDFYFYHSKSTRIKKLIAEIYELQSIISYLGYDVPIYDLYTKRELNGENIEKLLLKK